jgi:tetratricopeptide (TPR) repeat protein
MTLPMLLPLLLLAGQAAGPPDPNEARLHHCVALVRSGAAAALVEADRWRQSGGGHLAQQCAGLAEAAQGHWAIAAADFEHAARDAQVARDARLANYWAEAGNAWLAAGEPVKARAALDAALGAGTLTGLQRGEAQLDAARALVATGNVAAGRAMLDQALVGAAADPLAWLLSATLARRMDDLPRARTDIAQALSRSADDASVQLEAGNIAALSHDETGARRAWQQAVRIAPNSAQGRAAAAALQQFGAQGRPAGTMTGR